MPISAVRPEALPPSTRAGELPRVGGSPSYATMGALCSGLVSVFSRARAQDTRTGRTNASQ